MLKINSNLNSARMHFFFFQRLWMALHNQDPNDFVSPIPFLKKKNQTC